MTFLEPEYGISCFLQRLGCDSYCFFLIFLYFIFLFKIYNYQGVANEDYNIASTPAPNGKFMKYVMKVVILFLIDKLGE
jgi:hypothetical protein